MCGVSQEIIREELAEEVLADLSEVPKPIELLHILNHYVIGQDRAKRAWQWRFTTTTNASISTIRREEVRRCGFAEVKHLDDWPNRFRETSLLRPWLRA